MSYAVVYSAAPSAPALSPICNARSVANPKALASLSAVAALCVYMRAGFLVPALTPRDIAICIASCPTSLPISSVKNSVGYSSYAPPIFLNADHRASFMNVSGSSVASGVDPIISCIDATFSFHASVLESSNNPITLLLKAINLFSSGSSSAFIPNPK